MKIKSIFLSVLALAGLYAACTPEGSGAAPQIATEKGSYDVPQTGGEVTVKFVSSTSWTASVSPASSIDNVDGVSVSPEKGNGSDKPQELKVSFPANESYDRAATVQILGDGLYAAVTISQPGEKGEFIEVITCAEFLERPVDPSVWYILEGTVTKIAQGSKETDKYCNFYINDGTIEDGDGVYFYGLYDGKNGPQYNTAPTWLYANGVIPGYHMKVCTTRGQYGTTIEGVNTYVLEFTPPTTPVLSCDVKEITVEGDATTASFAITALNLTGWTVTTDATWLTSYTTSGTESGKIDVVFPANENPTPRTAVFTVSAAGVESLTLTLTQEEAMTPVLTESFSESIGDFTIENKTLPSELSQIWAWASAQYGMKGTAYLSGTSYAAESWLVSPEADLTGATAAKLKFTFVLNYGTPAAYAGAFYGMVIDGTNETKIEFAHIPSSGSWNWIDEAVDLTAFAGKKIKVAFVYKSTAENAPTAEVKNIKITKR